MEVDLPGLKAEEIELKVDGDWLLIRGRRVPKVRNGKRARTERPSGSFLRQFPLPADAQGEIRATLSNGVLEMHVPRAQPGEDLKQPQTPAREQHAIAV